MADVPGVDVSIEPDDIPTTTVGRCEFCGSESPLDVSGVCKNCSNRLNGGER